MTNLISGLTAAVAPLGLGLIGLAITDDPVPLEKTTYFDLGGGSYLKCEWAAEPSADDVQRLGDALKSVRVAASAPEGQGVSPQEVHEHLLTMPSGRQHAVLLKLAAHLLASQPHLLMQAGLTPRPRSSAGPGPGGTGTRG